MSGVRVTLKLATSLDGRIALADGTSQWITSSASRARGHELRAAHDAIMVGVGTVIADDPLLTARTIPMPARQPVRIVADSQARTSVNSKLMTSLNVGKVVIVTAGAQAAELAERCGETEALARSYHAMWLAGANMGTEGSTVWAQRAFERLGRA